MAAAGVASVAVDMSDIERTIDPLALADSSRPQTPVDTDRPVPPPASVDGETPKVPHPTSSEELSQSPTTPVSPISVDMDGRTDRSSLSSIALSEMSLEITEYSSPQLHDAMATPRVSGIRHMRKPSSLDILSPQKYGPPSRQSTLFDTAKDEPLNTPLGGWLSGEEMESKQILEFGHMKAPSLRSLSTAESASVCHSTSSPSASIHSRSGTPERPTSALSDEPDEVDWSQLDKNEEREKEDKDLPEGVEDESTTFLLARLEQENAKFSHPSVSPIPQHITRDRKGSRPPSMSQLKKLVQGGAAPSIRYSLASDLELPDEPPPMTELEFWVALVQNYSSTASRLPTLTTTKIRSGIPPPLRGVVWTSMAGARDSVLEDSYDKLQGEQSPYEGIINKDVGRSFPGVELFRDADGQGQQMLGRVLKCFSLHDKDIGYCQGLGFLVGPLLMNMGEKEAFCVLVRLMDHYDLRPSFLPSLSGLHMRIYQFSSLMKEHNKPLYDHLNELGVEPAYLSQWFLSCFAVTCPLPLLFRIYDVIFAEGANETVMRVALAIVRRNEDKMMASTEFEEVMQLLLGRAIWDPYGCNPDELVDDFTALGNIITHAKLAELEKEFNNQSHEVVGQSAGFLPDVQAAASRFLGRLWAPSHSHTPSKLATLTPSSAEKDATGGAGHTRRPSFFLRRSPSRQNDTTVDSARPESIQNGSAAAGITVTTDSETLASLRESTLETMSVRSKAESFAPSLSPIGGSHTPSLREHQELHGQIEDLLTALSELQREHAHMAVMLQKEREERNEDHRAVKKLVGKLKPELDITATASSPMHDARHSLPEPARPKTPKDRPTSLRIEPDSVPKTELEVLTMAVEERLEKNPRFSHSSETKAQLRMNLVRTREDLFAVELRSNDLAARLEAAEEDLRASQGEGEDARNELKELRVRVGDEFRKRQKLERTIQDMKAEARAMERKGRDRVLRTEAASDVPTLLALENGSRAKHAANSSAPSMVGLREFKLGRDSRRDSTVSVQSLRMSTPSHASHLDRSEARRSMSQPEPLGRISSPPAGGIRHALSAFEISEEPVSPAMSSTTETLRSPLPATPTSVFSPDTTSFGKRTSSLVTQDVLTNSENDTVPQETLLLELVNSKTAEAQARQEIDEMRRNLAVQRRRHEEAAQQMQAEMAAVRAEIRKANEATEAARAEAAAAKLLAPSSSPSSKTTNKIESDGKTDDSTSGDRTVKIIPPAPSNNDAAESKRSTTPTPTPPVTTGGGWFWSRRTASTTKATIPEEKKE